MKLLLSRDQVIDKLQISESTLWRLQEAGELRPVRLGRRVLFREQDVDALIERKLSGRRRRPKTAATR